MHTPNLTGVWKLIRGESDFGFLPPPRFRQDTIVHNAPQIHITTHQIDANGDNTAERNLTLGADPAEILILGKPRLISARHDGDAVIVETRSTVSGTARLIEDRWTLVAGSLTITRTHHQPGGPVHQTLRFRSVGTTGQPI